ncbi:MAG: TonB-dependent receptor [Phenylobacterium sp.]|nr:TonB-dependent receptor [Phenylobacterium sp.]
MMTRLASGAALTALVCAMSSAVYAQETTGAMRGQITDANGELVAGAAVSIVHVPSGTRSTTVSDTNGTYDARGLRVGGPYDVTVNSPATGSKTVTGVYTTLAQTSRLDVSFEPEVGELVVTGVVDPTANNNAIKTVLDAADVESVVSVTRDIRDLARRSALVTQNSRGDGGISIAGSNPRNNRVTIDGAQAQDDFGLNVGGLPTRRGPISLDAVEQFTVDAVPIDVENGDFSGGALDAVLKSGGNSFHGTLFTNYLNDGMIGRSIRGVDIPSQVSQTNYGAFLSGPIWKDRVFFAASYEYYESSDLTTTGPEGAGFANSVRGVTQATIDNVVGIFNSNYATDFDPGGVPRTKPILDEKYTLKLDANITDQHRLSLTARYALSEVVQRTNINTSTAGLDSQWYLTGEEDYSYVGELNSDWTPNFSTQLRVTYRDYERRQNPPSGQDFSDVQVCLAPTSGGSATTCDIPGQSNPSILRFGPDEFRHANELATDNLTINFKGEYSFGDHLFKAGFTTQKQKIFNIFIPTQDGQYYFDSIADFAAGRANRLRYTDAIGGRTTTDAAAALEYRLNSVFAQDTLDITPELQITAGVRYDWYTNDDPPPLNPNFLARNGFSNQTTYEGRTVLMPRVSFRWDASERLKVSGGLGLFSGGVPDVLASNPYGGGAGFLTSGVDIQRTATGAFIETTNTPGFNSTIGATALNLALADATTFYNIPGSVSAFQGGASASPTTEVAAFMPGFKFPSDWKLFLNAQYDLWDGWQVGLDVVATKVNDGLYVRDFRAQQLVVNGVGQFTPDGRIRYDGVGGSATQRAAAGITSANLGSARDLVLVNTDKGRGLVAAVSLRKSFDFGLDLTGSYAYQDIDDFASSLRFSSTQSSSYQSPAGHDPNEPAYGTSYEEIQHSFKFQADYSRKFFGDLETAVSLFAERRTGRSTSFVMGDVASGRSSVFGVNRGNNHLLYVPDMSGNGGASGLDYGLVRFADTATRDNFIKLVNQFDLPQNQIVPKGFYENDPIDLVDLHLSQELPSLIKGHKFKIVLDIQNVLNLLNDEWGIVEEYSDVNTVVRVSCANSAGTAVATGDPSCPRYRYQSFDANSLRENIDNNGRSLWTIQVGLRYQF